MKKHPIILSFLATLLTLPSVALGASGVSPKVWIQTIVGNFLNFIVWPIFFSVSVLVFIYAGFLFLTASGDPAKVTIARKLVVWGIVGIVVAIFAFSIEGIVSKIILG